MRLFCLIACLCLNVLAGAAPAGAEIRNPAEAIAIEVRPGWRRADGTHVAALGVRLRPGWKTYWRSAGAAGISPQMDWRGTKGARSVTPAWPTPTVFGPVGARSIGYDRDFVLPLLIPAGTDGTIRLRGTLDIGVCSDICLPTRIDVAADLPPAGRADPAIEAALRTRPRRLDVPARCTLRPGPEGMTLTGEMQVASQGGAEAVVFEVPDPSVWVTDAEVSRRGGELRAEADLMSASSGGIAVDRSRIRITVIGNAGAVEILGCGG